MKSRRLFFQPCWLPLVFRSFQSSVKKQIMCCFIFSILWCGSRPLTDMSKAPGCCIEVQCIAVQLRIERWLLNSTAVTRSNPEDGQRPNMDVIKIIVGISRLIAFKKLLDTGCCNFMVVLRCKRVWQVTHFSFIVQMCAAGCPNNVCGLCLNYQVFYISLLCFTGTLFWRSGENLNACWDIQAARHRFFFFCAHPMSKSLHTASSKARFRQYHNETDATWIWLRCRSRHHHCTWVLTHIGRSFGIQIGELGEPRAEGDIILIRFRHRKSSVE